MNETARIEAFSDGIFSIAATLLVLELKHPSPNLPFWSGIFLLWPGYLSFVLSFFFIGILWINHHRLFTHIQKADDWLMVSNLLLLLGIVFLPYPTALMASAVTMLDTGYSRDVAIFYNATYLVIALLFNLVLYVCVKRNLLDHHDADDTQHAIFKKYAWGPFFYLACLIMTWWSVPVSLVMNSAIAISFLIPPRSSAHAGHKH